MPPLRLEVFEVPKAPTSSTVVTDLNALEEARLASYEQGYTAGWEDAVSAQKDEKSQMATELAHNLQSLSFTYHEARAHVLKAIEPLLLALITQVLPITARAGLPLTVKQLLLPMAEQAAGAPITLLYNPRAKELLEEFVQNSTCPPLILIEEPTLGEGQIFLQMGDIETRIDIDSALGEITNAVTDFLTLAAKDAHHG
jgi:flagellar biosynthesis/type III secretory pathway protein FliH